jgi:hypothetical protein
MERVETDKSDNSYSIDINQNNNIVTRQQYPSTLKQINILQPLLSNGFANKHVSIAITG